VVKHYQKTTGSSAVGSGGNQSAQAMGISGDNVCVSEVHWSHDGNLLAAAIHDYIAVFDLRKFGKPLQQIGGSASSS
jgi:hypothetical protein